jgi:hypothetical protein
MAAEDPFVSSSLSLHELFQQQARQILDRSDLEEDQKQHILVAMSCPCTALARCRSPPSCGVDLTPSFTRIC